MEELLTNLAEALDMSVETLVAEYPTLRTQIQLHRTFGDLAFYAGVVVFGLACIIIARALANNIDWENENFTPYPIKGLVITLIIALILVFGFNIIGTWVTPDITALRFFMQMFG